MIPRRTLLGGITVSILAMRRAAEAQQVARVWRIGCVLTGTPEGVVRLQRAIDASLSSLGYVPGRNITVTHRVAPPGGAKPGDLPVEQPTRYEMYVNLRTAKALGITLPASLLERADGVIQ